MKAKCSGCSGGFLPVLVNAHSNSMGDYDGGYVLYDVFLCRSDKPNT